MAASQAILIVRYVIGNYKDTHIKKEDELQKQFSNGQ